MELDDEIYNDYGQFYEKMILYKLSHEKRGEGYHGIL